MGCDDCRVHDVRYARSTILVGGWGLVLPAVPPLSSTACTVLESLSLDSLLSAPTPSVFTETSEPGTEVNQLLTI